MFEIQDPHFLIRHEYAEDSAGAGRWRGGLGVDTEFRSTATTSPASCSATASRRRARGFGIFGGKPGSLNELVICDGDKPPYRPRSKEIVRGIRRMPSSFSGPAAAAATASRSSGRSTRCSTTCATDSCRRPRRATTTAW